MPIASWRMYKVHQLTSQESWLTCLGWSGSWEFQHGSSLSAADMQWPDVIKTIARQYGTILTDDVKTMSWREEQVVETKSSHCSQTLPISSQHFFPDLPKEHSSSHWWASRLCYQNWIPSSCSHHPLDQGRTQVECQHLWSKTCSFIDQYVKCNIPDDEELAQLVSKVQKHRHSATCRRHGKCWFHYPRPPSPETVIAHQSTAATYPEEQAEQAVKALAAVQNILDDKDTSEDISISMDELLLKAGVSSDMYLCGLKICSTGNSVVMKRKPSESWINTYNPEYGKPTWICSIS